MPIARAKWSLRRRAGAARVHRTRGRLGGEPVPAAGQPEGDQRGDRGAAARAPVGRRRLQLLRARQRGEGASLPVLHQNSCCASPLLSSPLPRA